MAQQQKQVGIFFKKPNLFFTAKIKYIFIFSFLSNYVHIFNSLFSIFFQNFAQATISRQTFACSFCTKVYSTEYGRRQHLKVNHNNRHVSSLTCNVCNQVITTAQNLLYHKNAYQHFTINDVIQPQIKSFMCSLCNFQTNLEAELTNHTKGHFPDQKNNTLFLYHVKRFQCPFKQCHFNTLQKDHMRYHFQQVHSSSEVFQLHLNTYSFTFCKKCNTQIPNSQFKIHNSKCK